MLSMTSALEKTKKTRCRVFVEVVTTSTVHIKDCVQIDLLLTCKRMYRGPRGTTALGAPNPLREWLICRREGTLDHRQAPLCAISGLKQRKIRNFYWRCRFLINLDKSIIIRLKEE